MDINRLKSLSFVLVNHPDAGFDIQVVFEKIVKAAASKYPLGRLIGEHNGITEPTIREVGGLFSIPAVKENFSVEKCGIFMGIQDPDFPDPRVSPVMKKNRVAVNGLDVSGCGVAVFQFDTHNLKSMCPLGSLSWVPFINGRDILRNHPRVSKHGPNIERFGNETTYLNEIHTGGINSSNFTPEKCENDFMKARRTSFMNAVSRTFGHYHGHPLRYRNTPQGGGTGLPSTSKNRLIGTIKKEEKLFWYAAWFVMKTKSPNGVLDTTPYKGISHKTFSCSPDKGFDCRSEEIYY
jgi:hypothetical protein